MHRIFKLTLLPLLLLALSACGGGGAGSSGFTPTYTYSIGGTLTGIAGRSVTLLNNGGDVLTVTPGGFTFATRLANAATYNVTVSSSPGQTCTVTNGTGTVNAANVTNVSVACTPISYSVSGTITGLGAATGLQLTNTASTPSTEIQTIAASSTAFTFQTPKVPSGQTYSVTVSAQPTGLTCSITNGSGTVVAGDITNVAVSCVAPCSACTIGGTLSGLQAGGSIVLQNNGGSNLTLSADGVFTIATGVASNAAYNVTILTPPANQNCAITYGTGTVTNASITSVNVFCGPLAPGAFVSTSSMAQSRSEHTVTRIMSGALHSGTAGNMVLVAGGYVAANTPTSSVEIYSVDGSTRTTVASLNAPRYMHTATALSDGSVLVVGGFNGTSALNSSERYYPDTNTWVTTPALNGSPGARYGHTATLLSDGTVLVTGGLSGSGTVLNTSMIYTPGTDTWTPAGNLNFARTSHTATLLADGTNRVLVVGGDDGSTFMSSVEYYDPASMTWTNDTSLPIGSAREAHTATLLASGQVLIAGGQGSVVFNDGWLYIPSGVVTTGGGWKATAANTLDGRYQHTATLLANNKVLLTGGNNGSAALITAVLYDPVADAWLSVGNLVGKRYQHAAALLSGGKVLVTGGNSGTTILATAELYDPSLLGFVGWSTTGSLNKARYRHTATRLNDGTVLAAGGWDGTTTLASSEYYSQSTGAWTPTGTGTGSLATPRYDHAAVVLTTGPNAGKLLAIGGVNGTTALASVEMYDPVGKTWTTTGVPALNTARYQHTATVLFDGRILVAGGTDGTSTLTSVEILDPAATTPAWAYVGSLTYGRYQHTATLLNGGKVLVAGGASGGTAISSAEVFDPTPTAAGLYLWSTGGTMPSAHNQHTATLLPNGKVLVAGGVNAAGTIDTAAALYDPSTNAWTITGSLTGARSLHTATLLPTGMVLAVGGLNSSALATSEMYDPAASSWAAKPNLATARYQHSATLLVNGTALVTGGWDGSATVPSSELAW